MDPEQKNSLNTENADPRWKDLYRLGSIASILIAVSITLAIAAYFIWPYKGNFAAMETIFSTLQTDRLGGLISLDLSMLLIAPINILMFLAIYAVLKQVNESWALIALVMALMAVVLVIQCRPLVELTVLSDKYAAATDAAEKTRYLATGETLRSSLDGTAWMMQTIFFLVSGLVNGLVMLRTPFFSKATAWTGIVVSAIGLFFFLPGIGLLFLFINTIGSVPWCILLARDFFRLNPQFQTFPEL
jgi:hypothetical protein